MLPTKFTPQAFTILIIYTQLWTIKTRCLIDLPQLISDPISPTSLIIKDDTSSSINYAYPKHTSCSTIPKYIIVEEGKKIGIYCPGGINKDSSTTIGKGYLSTLFSRDLHEGIMWLTCTRGILIHNGLIINVTKYYCHLIPIKNSGAGLGAILREINIDSEIDSKCHNGKLYEIGYEPEPNKFIRTIEICHDVTTANTLWAHAIIQSTNIRENRFSCDEGGIGYFKTGILYKSLSIGKLYSIKSESDKIFNIVQKRDIVEKYMSPDRSLKKYLAKGHLIASADKMYQSEQDSTWFYANTLPMWQKINAPGGNWFEVEKYVRNLVSIHKHNIYVWVGGIDVMMIDNKEIYLADGNKVPVPRVLFKCAVDQIARKAIIFLVVNDPEADIDKLDDENGEYRMCNKLPVCDNEFTQWNNIGKGYLYCCNFTDIYVKNYEKTDLEHLGRFLNYEELL